MHNKKLYGFAVVCFVFSCFQSRATETLWCRYRFSDGSRYEREALNINGNAFIISSSKENQYFWTCPDIGNDLQYTSPAIYCPHYLEATPSVPNDRDIFTDIYFVVNDIPEGNLSRGEFINQALTSCLLYTPHASTEFVEYGIKSSNDVDMIGTLFHKPVFAQVPSIENLNSLPFARVIVFGDSLSDNGNVHDLFGIPPWPYFMGRFSSGPNWIDDVIQTLNSNEKDQTFDLFNYAQGGSGALTNGYNPFKLSLQVDRYLSEMDYTGNNENIQWDPAYDRSLFIIFSGSNDYLSLAENTCEQKAADCGSECPTLGCDESPALEACANACALGVVESISKEIQNILENAANQKENAKYFMIPTQPDVTLTPRFNKNNFLGPLSEIEFLHTAILAHNKYLIAALQKLKQNHPEIEFLNFDVNSMFNDFLNNRDNQMMIKSGITNKTDNCLLSTSKNSGEICADPASYFFWDTIHPTMSAHCVLAETVLEQMYLTFGNGKTYNPQYENCHNSYSQRPCSDCRSVPINGDMWYF